MERRTVETSEAPAAVGPYSQAVRGAGFVFLSGQIPLDPETGRLIPGGAAAQTEAVLKSVKKILEAAGSGLERVVKVTVYLTDLDLFGEVNEVYARFFPADPPARASVEVSRLPKGALVEIDVTALEGER